VKQRLVLIAILLLAGIVVGVMLSSQRKTGDDGLASQRSEVEQQAPSSTPQDGEAETQPATLAEPPSTATEAGSPMVASVDPSYDDEHSEDPAKMFRADAAGNLILQERTRLNVEKLMALYAPAERQDRLTAIEQALPPSAYRQLTDLLEHYENFSRAAKQEFPPGRAPTTVEEAIEQHEGLHALRVAHFGAAATDAMFGKEEAIGRRLLDFMALEKHEGLTMEEKAIKAQELLLRSPELAEAYEKNRNTPPNPQ
jgi:hypothetical protein